MTVTSPAARWRFWVAMAALFLVTLWLLNNILLPFVVGIVVAQVRDRPRRCRRATTGSRK